MSDKPIWLLDVDGVINAFDESGPVMGDWGDWTGFTARGFPIRYSPKMIARILALHEADRVEVRWLTTWGRHANTDLPELGLPEFAVAAEMPFRERDGWWKLPVAQELFDQGHAIIWTDDDMAFVSDAQDWLRAVGQTARGLVDLHAFAPKGAISQAEMDGIEAWLAARTPLGEHSSNPREDA